MNQSNAVLKEASNGVENDNVWQQPQPPHSLPPIMQTPTYVIPKAPCHQAFVTAVMAAARALSEENSIVRLRMDASAKSVVSFTAGWFESPSKTIDRRVYVETALTDDEKISVIFMTKIFDDNAINRLYPASDTEKVSADIMLYLRKAEVPD